MQDLSLNKVEPLFPGWVPNPHAARLRDPGERSPARFVIGLLLSLILHGILLMVLPKHVVDNSESSPASPPMVVQLNQQTLPATPSSPVPPSAAPPRTTPQPRPRRSILAVPRQVPQNPATAVEPQPPPEPEPPVTRPMPVPTPNDFSSMVEARRAQRQANEQAMARENAAARAGERAPSADEAASAALSRNLKTLGNGSGGGTGGVFKILYKGHRYAQYAFNGWKPTAANTWREVIDVDAGQGGDVELAIARSMIALIRKYYQGDFNWESHRLGRVVTLSARLEDTKGLEEFLVKEFFGTGG